MARPSYSNYHFYKENHKTFGSKLVVYLVFYVTEDGWVRREGKGEEDCGRNFPLELFVRITFPIPWSWQNLM